MRLRVLRWCQDRLLLYDMAIRQHIHHQRAKVGPPSTLMLPLESAFITDV